VSYSAPMFIAMNRFQVKKGHEDAFQKVWAERQSYLGQVEGFVRFHLLRSAGMGPEAPHCEFVSYSQWTDRKAFEGWLHGDFSKKAHSSSSGTREMLAGPPQFTGYEAVLDEVPG